MKSVFLFIVLIVLNTYSFKLSEKSKISLHISISASITYTSCMYLRRTNKKISLKGICLTGAVMGMVPGFFKEANDFYNGHTFSGLDIGCDAIGVGLSSLLYYAIHKKLDPKIYDGYFLIEGIDKHRDCVREKKYKRKSIIEFENYIMDIFNNIKSDSSYGLGDSKFYSIQLMIIVDQYLESHPERVGLSANFIIKLALAEIFSPKTYKELISD